MYLFLFSISNVTSSGTDCPVAGSGTDAISGDRAGSTDTGGERTCVCSLPPSPLSPAPYFPGYSGCHPQPRSPLCGCFAENKEAERVTIIRQDSAEKRNEGETRGVRIEVAFRLGRNLPACVSPSRHHAPQHLILPRLLSGLPRRRGVGRGGPPPRVRTSSRALLST